MPRSSLRFIIFTIAVAISLTGVPIALGQGAIGPEQAKRNLIKEAARITDLGMGAARAALERAWTENMTEAMVAKEIEDTMTDHGSNPYVEAFPPIVASGNDSAIPHGDGSNDATNQILPGEVVVVDIGARFKGWVADETRTFYMGDDPPEEFIEVYNIVKEAHDLAVAAFRVGNIAGDIDKIARDYIEAAGYGENFTHCLGHGMGVYVHQPPMLCPGSTHVIMAWSDQVVTSEPGIYLEGNFGVRIESDYAILRTGPEKYTLFPDDMETVLIKPTINITNTGPSTPDVFTPFDIWDQAKLAFILILVVGVAFMAFRLIRRRRRRVNPFLFG